MKSRSNASDTADEVLENLRSLIAEAEELIGKGVSTTSAEVLEDVRSRLSEGLDKLNDYYGDAKKKVVAATRQTDQTIRSHPYESLAIALGVGILAGALIRRK